MSQDVIGALRAECLKSDAVLIDHWEWVMGQEWLKHLHRAARLDLEDLCRKKEAVLRGKIPYRILECS